MIQKLETIGTYAGIIGAFLVAFKLGKYGYPFFTVSAVCLLYSCVKQKQWNHVKLQTVFLLANLIGLVNYA